MDRPGLGDDLLDRHPRVERGGRVLEHQLHLAPAGVEGLGGRHGEEVLALRRVARPSVGVDRAASSMPGERRFARARTRRRCRGSRPAAGSKRHVVDRACSGAVASCRELAAEVDLRDMLDSSSGSPGRGVRFGTEPCGRGRRRSACGCRGASAWWYDLADRAALDDLARPCITTTRSAISATTPRSWVMRTSPMPHLA